MAYEDALAAIQHLPETRETQEQAIDLRLDMRVPLQPLSRVRRLLEHARAAEAIARTLEDERRLGRISSGLSNDLWVTGDHFAAIAAATRALDIGERLGDLATRATAILRLGAIHHTIGEYEKAVTYLRQAADLTADDRQRERFGMAGIASVLTRHWLARTLAQLGDFSEALAVAREGLDINLSMDNLTSLPSAHLAVGYVHLHRGELVEAQMPFTRAVDIGQATEVLNWESLSISLLGLREALSGHPAEGIELTERAHTLHQQRDEPHHLPLIELWRGEAYLTSGIVTGRGGPARRALS